MSTPGKDFGPIADDYVFFEQHSTEARQDIAAYVDQVRRVVPADGTLRMLDFGCGSGTVTARFLELLDWPPSRLQLMLVEPVESARRQAVTRVARWSDRRVLDSAAMPDDGELAFDLILANHVFYYVPDLTAQLARLLGCLSDTGIFTTAIASRRNALIQFWIAGFRMLGMEVPYHTAENVQATLQAMGTAYEKQIVPYELAFEDTEQNRMSIIRFLFADHLAELPRQPLLDLFDPYAHAGRIDIWTASDHYSVC